MENKNEGNEIRFSNPFTLKFGQVFTGFGIGCGVGIGVGSPLNLGTTLLSLPYSLPISHYYGFRKNLVQTQISPKFPYSKTMYLLLPFSLFFFFLILILLKLYYVILIKLLSYSEFVVGAIPMLNQVMSATRGATDAFSGVSRHVNTSVSNTFFNVSLLFFFYDFLFY
jgi:hypothetical protein